VWVWEHDRCTPDEHRVEYGFVVEVLRGAAATSALADALVAPPQPAPAADGAGEESGVGVGGGRRGGGGRGAGGGGGRGGGAARWLAADAPLVVLDANGRRLAGDAPARGAIALLAEGLTLPALEPTRLSAADVAACAGSVAGARAVATEQRRRAEVGARTRAAHAGMRTAAAWCRAVEAAGYAAAVVPAVHEPAVEYQGGRPSADGDEAPEHVARLPAPTLALALALAPVLALALALTLTLALSLTLTLT
jgi:hypothetical protein